MAGVNNEQLVTQLRNAVTALRRTSMPLANVIPLLQEAADAITQVENEATIARQEALAEVFMYLERAPMLPLRDRTPDELDKWTNAIVNVLILTGEVPQDMLEGTVTKNQAPT